MDKEELVVNDKNTSEENLPEVVTEHPISIANEPREILTQIKQADTKEELEGLEEMFKLSMAKKELARVATQDELMDKILEQARKRIDKAGELSNKELLDYYNAFDNIVSRTTAKSKTEDSVAPVQITKNDVTINMDSAGLNRDSQNRVLDVIKDILAQANSNNPVESNLESEEGDIEDDD